MQEQKDPVKYDQLADEENQIQGNDRGMNDNYFRDPDEEPNNGVGLPQPAKLQVGGELNDA